MLPLGGSTAAIWARIELFDVSFEVQSPSGTITVRLKRPTKIYTKTYCFTGTTSRHPETIFE